jgi:hypothetical protein
MTASCDIRLVVHGAIILLLSQLAGFAFLFSINAKQQNSEKTGMWRMSHAASSAGAVFLMALAPILPQLRLTMLSVELLAASLVVSTYGLCLGTVVAGFSGHRGTRLRLPWPNLLACLLYLVGVLGSVIGGPLLLYGALRAYLGF